MGRERKKRGDCERDDKKRGGGAPIFWEGNPPGCLPTGCQRSLDYWLYIPQPVKILHSVTDADSLTRGRLLCGWMCLSSFRLLMLPKSISFTKVLQMTWQWISLGLPEETNHCSSLPCYQIFSASLMVWFLQLEVEASRSTRISIALIQTLILEKIQNA